jgi:DNA polymerase-4
MPIGEARRRAPKARYLPPDMREYAAVSKDVFAVIEGLTPFIERLSIDEAFLDIGGLRHHFASAEDVAVELRRRIAEDVGIPASAGISTVKFIAKMASGDAKPNGVLLVPAGKENEFLHPKPVRSLWGVGQATYAAFETLGIATIGDVAATPVAMLQQRLGPSIGFHLHELAMGRDPREVESDVDVKSVSVETTFSKDLVADEEIDVRLLGLCDELAVRLRRNELAGRTVTLKIRFGDFSTFTRSVTPGEPVASRPPLVDAARDLLRRVERRGRPVRLLGVGVSHLLEGGDPEQLSMFGETRTAAAEAVEEVRSRFGDGAIGVGRLAEIPRRRGSDSGQTSP